MSESHSAHTEVQDITALVNGGRFEQAIELAQSRIGKSPASPILHLLAGIALTGQKKLELAIEHFRRAIALKPDFFDALNNLGVCLHRLNMYSEAAEYFRQALRVQPSNMDVQYNLASVVEAMGSDCFSRARAKDAVALFEQALAYRPSNARTLTNLGIALIEISNFEQARIRLQEAIRLAPSEPVSLGNLALALKGLGKPYIAVLQQIIQLSGDGHSLNVIKMWAALSLDLPSLAYTFKSPKLNIMDYADQEALYRRPDLQDRIAALPPLSGTHPVGGGRAVFYAGGDGVYAERFARDLIGSAMAANPDCDFHIHLMNLGRFKPDEAFSQFPKGRVTWTIEDMGPCNKILYAPRRWIRLAQLQHRFERLVMLVDTDGVLNGNILKALPERFDIAVYERPKEILGHQILNGAFIATTPAGRDFIDFLAAYILHYEERGLSKWYDDQLNIIVAREWFKRNVPDLDIIAVDSRIMDCTGTNQPDHLIWHAKGHLKH